VRQGRFREALSRFEGDQDTRHQSAEAEFHLAMAAARVGEYHRATRLAGSALRRFVDVSNRGGQLHALNLLGGVSFEQGRLDDAECWFRDAQRLAEAIRDAGIGARAWNNLALIAHLRGRPHLAVETWRRALRLYEELQDTRGAVQTHHNLGLAYRELGLLHAAHDHVALAMKLVDQVSDPSLKGLVVLGQAELEFSEGAVDRAAALLEQATQIATASDDQTGLVNAGRLRALMALRARQYQLAKIEATAAREKAELLGARILAAECGVIAALAFRALGDDCTAEPLHRRSCHALERLGADRLSRWADREWTRATASGRSG
jgi:tetratricopeptide (TPR) repeat protein